MALLKGARLVMVADEVIKDPDRLIRFCINEYVTVSTFPPTYLKSCDVTSITSLRVIISAGEPLPGDLLSTLQGNERAVFNAYGPTEYSVCTSIHKTTVTSSRSVPIGKPIANTIISVRNSDLKEVMQGIAGELCIAGIGLARGYLNNTSLTNEKFVIDNRTLLRMYRSGDLVLINDLGNLEYIGRLDEQVKINGFRIEPGEIEHATRTHSNVAGAVAIVETIGDPKIFLFVVLRDASLNHAGYDKLIRNYLADIIPEYMIPSGVSIVESIPLTSHGKIDKQQLLENRTHFGGDNVTRSLTPIESSMLEVWRQLLRNPDMGPDDNYFEFGGDSILAIRLISRLRTRKIHVSISDLNRFPTVSGLSAKAEVTTDNQRDNDYGDVPLTPIQHQLFKKVASNIDLKALSNFNFSILVETSHQLSSEKVIKALQQIVNAHEALSFEFMWDGSAVKQRSRKCLEIQSLLVVDMDKGSEPDELITTSFNQLVSTLDLSSGILFAASLFKASNGNKLLLVFHHAVVDIVSVQLFIEQLERLLGGEAIGPRSVSFRKWSKSLVHYSQSIATGDLAVDWLKLLQNNSSSLVERVAAKTSAVAFERVTLPSGTTELLPILNRFFDCKTNELLIALTADAVGRTFGRTHFNIQIESHGRNYVLKDIDTTGTIGWFTSVYPIPVIIEYGDEWERRIHSLKKMMRSIPNGGIDFGLLLQHREDLSIVQPLVQVAFNYDGIVESNATTDGFRISPMRFQGESH
ncbi:MAG: condensation domain-containing protein, partial [Flammeovirgaceae bacterium]